MIRDVMDISTLVWSSKAIDDAFKKAKWFAIVSRGTFAFRFGPFSGPEIGKIIEQCAEEKIPLFVTADCETPFNWEVAREMRGFPEAKEEVT